MTDKLVGELAAGMPNKGEAICVVSLRNRNDTERGRMVTDEVSDKLATSVIRNGTFDAKERLDLRPILGEKDLENSQLVRNPKVQAKLSNVKYIIMGGVSLQGNGWAGR